MICWGILQPIVARFLCVLVYRDTSVSVRKWRWEEHPADNISHCKKVLWYNQLCWESPTYCIKRTPHRVVFYSISYSFFHSLLLVNSLNCLDLCNLFNQGEEMVYLHWLAPFLFSNKAFIVMTRPSLHCYCRTVDGINRCGADNNQCSNTSLHKFISSCLFMKTSSK